MARYMLIAMNGPTDGEGDEAAYNRWYDEVHVPDLEAIDGVLSARRFEVVRRHRAPWPYVAVYEIETDDVDALMKRMETEPRPFTPAFDRSVSAMLFAIERPGAET